MKKITRIMVPVISFFAHAQEMPEPYRSVVDLPVDMHHWFAYANQKNLAYLIQKIQPCIVVELGSWLGASAIFMASRLGDGGRVYAVDDWTASTDISIQKDTSVHVKLPTLYQQFLSNVKAYKLTHKIVPVRMKTLEAAQALNVHADLIYVDASHDEESVYKDIVAWYPKLNRSGIMCGDDWDAPSVQAGVQRAARELGLIALSDASFWYFLPKK